MGQRLDARLIYGRLGDLESVADADLGPMSGLDGRVLSTRRASDPESMSPGVEGETLVYVLSDDNFNAGQSTLLMMFALEE